MLEEIPAKTIVTRTKDTQWFGTSYNMNIYKGCCHGCIYCDSRSDCYQVQDFDRVRVKKDALRIIRDDLRRKVRKGVVGTGAMSDPYNPFEKELELTRHALELLDAYEFGVKIATKSALILRDMDVLKSIGEHNPVICNVTITTIDDSLSKRIEPGVPPSSERFDVVGELAKQGIFAGILLMPVLPFLEDTWENVSGILDKAVEAGARYVYPAFGMTLRQNQRDWYFEKLNLLFPDAHLPDRYLRRYGNRYTCTSPKAKELWEKFSAYCDEKGLLYRMKDIISSSQAGYDDGQLSFL